MVENNEIDTLSLAIEQAEKKVAQREKNKIGGTLYADQDIFKPTKVNKSESPLQHYIVGDYVNRYEKFMPGANNEALNDASQGWGGALANGLGGMLFNANSALQGYFRSNLDIIDAVEKREFNKLWDTEENEQDYYGRTAMTDYYAVYDSKDKPKTILGGLTSQFSSEGVGNLMQSLGFTIGTATGIAAESALIGAGTGLVGGVVNALSKSKKLGTSMYQVVKGLNKADKTFDALRTSGVTAKALNVGKNLVMPAIRLSKAAVAEGSMESMASAKEFEDEQLQAYRDTYGVEPPEEYKKKVKEEAVKVGNFTLGVNLPVLMVSDALMMGNLIRTGKIFGKNVGDAFSDVTIQNGVAKTAKQAAKEAGKKEFYKYKGKQFIKSVLGATPEMAEEMAQGIGASAAKNYYDLMKSDPSKTFVGALGELVKTAEHELFVDKGIWQEGWAGLLTGGIMKGAGFVKDRLQGVSKAREKQIADFNYGTERLGLMTDSLNEESDFSTTLGSPTSRQRRNNPGIVDIGLIEKMKNGATQTNSSVGMSVAETQNNEKKYHDYKNEALKSQLLINSKLGKADLAIEMFSQKIGALNNEEYARDIMGDATVSEAEVMKHKNKTIESFTKKQKEFDNDYNEIMRGRSNPFNASKNPNEHSKWDQMIGDILFYKQDADNSFERMTQLSKRLHSEIENGAPTMSVSGRKERVRENDILVLSDTEVRSNELKRINEEIKNQEIIASKALDENQKKAAQDRINELRPKQDLLSKMSALTEVPKTLGGKNTIYAPTSNANKKAFQNLAKQWIELTTGVSIEEGHSTHRVIADLIELEDESRFFLTLYNSLLGDKVSFERYAFGYLNESRIQNAKNDKGLKEKEAIKNEPNSPYSPLSTDERNEKREETRLGAEETLRKNGVDNISMNQKDFRLSEDNRVPNDIEHYYFEGASKDNTSISDFITKLLNNKLVSNEIKSIFEQIKGILPENSKIVVSDKVLESGVFAKREGNTITISSSIVSFGGSFEAEVLRQTLSLISNDYIQKYPDSAETSNLKELISLLNATTEAYRIEDFFDKLVNDINFQNALKQQDNVAETAKLFDDAIKIIESIMVQNGVSKVSSNTLKNVINLKQQEIEKTNPEGKLDSETEVETIREPNNVEEENIAES